MLLLALTTSIPQVEKISNYAPLHATVEADFVFPPPNATYKRTSQFSLIFALQGMKEGWPRHIRLRWELYPGALSEDYVKNTSWQERDIFHVDWGSLPYDIPRDVTGPPDGAMVPSGTGGLPPGGKDT